MQKPNNSNVYIRLKLFTLSTKTFTKWWTHTCPRVGGHPAQKIQLKCHYLLVCPHLKSQEEACFWPPQYCLLNFITTYKILKTLSSNLLVEIGSPFLIHRIAVSYFHNLHVFFFLLLNYILFEH